MSEETQPNVNGIIVPHSRPFVGLPEVQAISSVLMSHQLAQGYKVRELEQRWCEATGTRVSAAVGSGVAALRLALLALEVGPEDEVIVPAYSCVALFNAVLALGATPVPADVIPDYWTLAPDDVHRHLTRRTKAIIAVHLFGCPFAFAELAVFGLPIVEDCAHGIGGFSGDSPFGGIGTLSMSSFYATKMLVAGEGGIVAGYNPTLIDRVRQARDYGDQSPDGRHLNDKMTDIEASLALVQLSRLSDILARREDRARRYHSSLESLYRAKLVELPIDIPGRIWYRYAVRLTRHMATSVVEKMAAEGVRAEQPVWDLRRTKVWNDTFVNSSLAFDHIISLPLYPDLTELEQNRVCAAFRRCLEDA